MKNSQEYLRLSANENWKKWGPYLSERAWGTVREDYSANGSAWDYFSHDHARSRVYRWNEDGMAGICDDKQFLCFALSLWNKQDPILKERMFGLTNSQGNHGEDVKEYYFYLDSTPTHSYMKMLYKYPHKEFPYNDLISTNGKRGKLDFEYELLDTGVFNNNEYFDVFVEYAKSNPENIYIKISVVNRGENVAHCEVLPTLWFRNTWKWGYPEGPRADVTRKPGMEMIAGSDSNAKIKIDHSVLGTYYLYAKEPKELIFTDNETNNQRLYNSPNDSMYVKDAFHRYIINNEKDAVNPNHTGTKSAAVYDLTINPGETKTICLRLTNMDDANPFNDFETVFNQRKNDADEFYSELQPPTLSDDARNVQRQGFAGLLWSKQLYYYDVEQWMYGDPSQPKPPQERKGKGARNVKWTNIENFDIISMPDKWEYPWFASWDWALQCIPLSLVDVEFAKSQLRLILDDRYLNAQQIPAYEWSFSDLNPPVVVYSTWKIYNDEKEQTGKGDLDFLIEMFSRLDGNFHWWYNYEDADGKGLFQGGFMGLDNISVFDRSHLEIMNAHIDQSDSTAWMGLYTLTMMDMALEIAEKEKSYQKQAGNYLHHYYKVMWAANHRKGSSDANSLWDNNDGIYYDNLHFNNPESVTKLKIRSLVGLMPLLAIEVHEQDRIEKLFPNFAVEMHRLFTDLYGSDTSIPNQENNIRHFGFVDKYRLTKLMNYISDENEFLSDFGIRSLSKFHQANPYSYWDGLTNSTIEYNPAESTTGLFGGNSNWRGPIWFPINYLLIQSLKQYGKYWPDKTFEFPKGSGKELTLNEIAADLSKRMINIFLKDHEGKRPVYGGTSVFQNDPAWKDNILFYEYFHGDNGAGLGASHQTGWTALVTELIQQTI